MDRDKSKGSLKMITTINFEQTIFTLPPENEPLLCYTKWDEVNDFSLIIIDEAHRNTLGAQAMKVLDHFQNAKVLGITATPFRSDKRELSEFYESICFEIPLPFLIALGYIKRAWQELGGVK